MTQEERVRGIVQAQEERPEVLGFAVRAENKGAGRGMKVDKTGLTCTYCKYSGHEVTNCFELNGYPDWWGDRPRLGIKNGGRGRSTPTGAAGAGRGRATAKAHAAVTETVPKPSPKQAEGSSGQTTPLPGFTAEQWNSLLSVIGNSFSTNERMAGPSLEEADWNG
ncbi:unnamed protein product [Cuscuta epithymum]|uniref:Uncharacterized protein n=1 Tax=Cuscuta epithymum TaxID=186058 RepID=A0AAV0FS51_9ASTE|nr:unnamed protein product [Cuscuta epithymum]